MDDKKNYEIFDGKTLSGLFEDIYKNSDKTRTQITNLIQELKKFITKPDEAMMIVPLIAQYLEITVKSDQQKVQLADIVQKLLKADKSKDGEDNEFALSDEERRQLLDTAKDYAVGIRQSAERDEEKIKELQEKTAKIKSD